MEEEDLESKLSWNPLTASLIACLGTGAYVGYTHAGGGVTSLIPSGITTVLYALVYRNEANPTRNNPDSQEYGKTMLTVVGAGAGVVLNAVGYAIGYVIGHVVNR